MTEKNDSPQEVFLTEEHLDQVQNLLKNGGGVTYDQIAQTIDYKPILGFNKMDELEIYLLKQIARGLVRRVWNREAEDHFYMAVD